MRRIDEVWMCRAEVSGELVQSVVSNKDTGRDVQHAVFSIEVLNGGAAARRVTFAKDFLKIAVQKLNNSIIHRSIPVLKVISCSELASDLGDVATLKARARKFVLRRHAAAVRFSDRRCAVRRTAANLIHGALPLK